MIGACNKWCQMYQPWHQLSQFAAHHPLSSANKNVSRQLDTITQPARSDLFQFNGKYTVNTQVRGHTVTQTRSCSTVYNRSPSWRAARCGSRTRWPDPSPRQRSCQIPWSWRVWEQGESNIWQFIWLTLVISHYFCFNYFSSKILFS